jgi:hypothetical protein
MTRSESKGLKVMAPRRRSAKSDRKAAQRAEKMADALSYRRLGYTYAQISETMGISIGTAHNWVTAAIKNIPAEEAALVRKQMLDRLDYMSQSLMRAVVEETADSSIINALLAIEERRAKLLGVYDLVAYGDYDDPESRAGRMLGIAIAQIKADAPVLKPDAPVPLVPIL